MEPSTTKQKPKKRSRTPIACRRCKSRKQKCDGQHPVCSNCANSEQSCDYDVSPSLLRSRVQYLRAVQRVEELEGILLQAGLIENRSDGWHEAEATAASNGGESLKRQRDERELGEGPAVSETDEPQGVASTPNGSMDSFVDVLRDLSLEAGGGYVGASSAISMGRMLSSIVKAKEDAVLSSQASQERMSPKSLNGFPMKSDNIQIPLGNLAGPVADRMLQGYFRHIATLWPLFQTSYIRELHANRSALQRPFEVATLNLVYAAGGRFLETTGETGQFHSEMLYATAAGFVDEILQLHDIRSVQILLMLAIYSLRAPKGPGAWSFVGLAMRLAVDLGLHRRARSGQMSVADDEVRRCVFWSCYCLDRQISIILGRPFAISDRDIDVQLPTGANEASEPASFGAPDSETRSPMDCFIHICKLRIIESHIQQNIYRVDQPGASAGELESFICQLDLWKADIPVDAQLADKKSINGYDYYMVYYYKCLRFLLYPSVSSPEPSPQYLQRCVEACGGVCQTYKRLHQNVTVGFSLMALHSVFSAGLTLLYCSWVSPQEIFNIKANSHINACSIVLYVIAERWPGARKYRDIFEAIKQSVMEAIEDGQYAPRRAIKKLKPDMQEALRALQPLEGGPEDLSALMAEMSAEPLGFSGFGQQAAATATLSPLVNVMPGLAFDFSLPTSGPGYDHAYDFSQADRPTSANDWLAPGGFTFDDLAADGRY